MSIVISRAAEKATALHESCAAAAQEIAERNATLNDRVRPEDMPMSRSVHERRERGVRRIAESEARTVGARRAFAEVAYRAVPLDEESRSKAAAQLIADGDEMARRLGVGDPVEAGTSPAFLRIAEEAAAAASPAAVGDDMSTPAVQARARDAVSAACSDPSHPLAALVNEAAAEIQTRVVNAARLARRSAATLEEQVGSVDGDGEDADGRRRMIAGRYKPTLIESLFRANFRVAVTEGGAAGEPARDLALAEAAAQYALIEASNAFGLLPPGLNAGDLAQEISRAAIVTMARATK